MIYNNFQHAREALSRQFITAPAIHGQKWQGVDISQRPEAKMIELLHESFRVMMVSEDLEHWREDIKPNLPWADDHFEERVCGYPINPGVQWKKWPWGHSAADHLDLYGERFNHNYMERYWPKFAGVVERATETAEEYAQEIEGDFTPIAHQGIRAEYGDLNDLVNTLAEEPDTRQAYLPIYYPEDVTVQGRKPCTLGYHFILRHGYFHCTYYMRSCDFYRHWADDCYLTIRLHLWIMHQLRKRRPKVWDWVRPGFFIMHITSLHMFINDTRPMGIEWKGPRR